MRKLIKIPIFLHLLICVILSLFYVAYNTVHPGEWMYDDLYSGQLSKMNLMIFIISIPLYLVAGFLLPKDSLKKMVISICIVSLISAAAYIYIAANYDVIESFYQQSTPQLRDFGKAELFAIIGFYNIPMSVFVKVPHINKMISPYWLVVLSLFPAVFIVLGLKLGRLVMIRSCRK